MAGVPAGGDERDVRDTIGSMYGPAVVDAFRQIVVTTGHPFLLGIGGTSIYVAVKSNRPTSGSLTPTGLARRRHRSNEHLAAPGAANG